MGGWFKGLIAATCVAELAAIGWWGWGEWREHAERAFIAKTRAAEAAMLDDAGEAGD